MSTNLPPTGPPSGPPFGPPSGPPVGPPPAGPPPAATTELLEQGGGGPLPPAPPTKSSGGGRRRALIIGGVVGAAALGGAAFGAYTWFTGTGPQPAEALPAGTLGYVSIDLDPSGEQKIAFYNTAKKFPAIKEWLDDEGIGSGDDIRKFIFDKVQAEESACEGLDFDDDIQPWMGDRFAFAAVDRAGDEAPAPVGVIQVKDADQALERVEKLIEDCGGDRADGGLAISGDWLIVAESDEIAEQVADDAAEGSLADDEDYQKWTDAAGDPGILTAYASPEAGKALADAFGGVSGLLGSSGMAECVEIPELDENGQPIPSDGLTDECLPTDLGDEVMPDEDAIAKVFEEFGPIAMTVRFDDGGVEIEGAGDTSGMGGLAASDSGDDVIATLPGDTAAAYGVGFDPGWVEEMLDYFAEFTGEELDLDAMFAEAETELDLALPEDLETLLGDSAAIAFGKDFDPEAFINSSSGPSELPVGVKIEGDPDAIQEILDKIKATAPSEEEASLLSTESDGDMIAIGPNADYLTELLENGDLGDSDLYQDVVRDEDASQVLFISFDAVDELVGDLASGDDEILENFEPLAAFGITSWEDDGVGHGVMRLTTD